MNTENQDKRRSLFGKMQGFMASYRGKVILNYAYSWGAAIVIMGALFKLTHLPGANMMLWIGMGTEVLVFFVSAFDLPSRSSGTGGSSNVNIQLSGNGELPEGNVINVNAGSGGGGGGVHYVGDSVAPAVAPVVAPGMETATEEYLKQLREMTENISRFAKQAETLSNDAEQMSTLNKNLSGINAIYEIQLRSVSAQIGTIDQVHEQTRKMARQIEELNAVYARMLEAMNAGNK